jgi:uncharacterized membrane protein SirB2
VLVVIKGLHILLAALSVSGFVARGYGLVRGAAWLDAAAVRASARVVDAVLIISGLILALGLTVNPLVQTWLGWKLIAIVIYVALGVVALRVGRRNLPLGAFAFMLALLAFTYVVATAVTKDPAFLL